MRLKHAAFVQLRLQGRIQDSYVNKSVGFVFCFYLIFLKYPIKMKQLETKLFRFHRIFKNRASGMGGGGWRSKNTEPLWIRHWIGTSVPHNKRILTVYASDIYLQSENNKYLTLTTMYHVVNVQCQDVKQVKVTEWKIWSNITTSTPFTKFSYHLAHVSTTIRQYTHM